jgi:hypothetical protein
MTVSPTPLFQDKRGKVSAWVAAVDLANVVEDIVHNIVQLFNSHTEELIAAREEFGGRTADDVTVVSPAIYDRIADISPDKSLRLRVVDAHEGKEIRIGAFGYGELEQDAIYSAI